MWTNIYTEKHVFMINLYKIEMGCWRLILPSIDEFFSL